MCTEDGSDAGVPDGGISGGKFGGEERAGESEEGCQCERECEGHVERDAWGHQRYLRDASHDVAS